MSKKIIVYDDYNGKIPPIERQGIVGAITTQFGNPAPRHGWKIIEVEDEQDEELHQLCIERQGQA